jgi:RNA-directed DNA polymerase
MKLEKENIDEIKKRFEAMTSTSDLAALLQWVYEIKFPSKNPESRVVIGVRELNYYAFKAKDRYVNFEIPKKNKKETRPISAPRYKLKTIQKCINEVLYAVLIPHKAAYGFIPNRSVVDNAKMHVGKNFVYNIDIEGFFPSTDFRRVKTVLGLKPFNLKETREPLAFLIANLCCENGCLPQGAPTSPTITNIVCQRLDKSLTKLAKRYGATYSRYADDITFSSHSNIFDKWFKARLKVIIERKENYKINLSKERLQDWNKRQEVTGVIVNKNPNVNREYLKDVRYWLRTWEKFDTAATQSDFTTKYPSKKSFGKYSGNIIPFQNYLMGKILYFGMVRGMDDNLFVGFKERFEKLKGGKIGGKPDDALAIPNKEIHLSDILRTWELEGFEKAMKIYQ